MLIREPTVIYRSLDPDSVRDLAGFLRTKGIQARPAVPEPYCSRTFPIAQTLHELLAVNFDPEDVAEQIEQWKAEREQIPDSRKRPFCYHCGEELTNLVPQCPSCHRELDLSPQTFELNPSENRSH